MKEIKLKIEGMHCTGCSSRLENVLNKKEGIEASVDFDEKQAKIKYDEDKFTLEDIKEIIENAGFKGE